MKHSKNFSFFDEIDQRASDQLKMAEQLIYTYPVLSVQILRPFVEWMVERLEVESGSVASRYDRPTFRKRIDSLYESEKLPPNVYGTMRAIWIDGNKALHELDSTYAIASVACERAFHLAVWFGKELKIQGSIPQVFQQPQRHNEAPSEQLQIEQLEYLKEKLDELAQENEARERSIRDLAADKMKLMADLGKAENRAKAEEEKWKNIARSREEKAKKKHLQLEEKKEQAKALKEDLRRVEGELAEIQTESHENQENQQLLEDEIERLRKKIDIGRDAWKEDYPRGDWRAVPQFYRDLLFLGKAPFDGFDPLEDNEEPFASGRWGEIFEVTSEKGIDSALVKLPRVLPPQDGDSLVQEQEAVWRGEEDQVHRIFQVELRPDGLADVLDVAPRNFPGFIIYRRIVGITLREYLSKAPYMALKDAIGIILRLSKSLEGAIEASVAYTDLSMDNIILKNESPELPFLVDLGKCFPRFRPPQWEGGSIVSKAGILDRKIQPGQVFLLSLLFFEMLLPPAEFDSCIGGMMGNRGYSSMDDSLAHLEPSPSKFDLRREKDKLRASFQKALEVQRIPFENLGKKIFNEFWNSMSIESGSAHVFLRDLRHPLQEVLSDL